MRKNWLYKKLDDCCEVEYGTRVVQKKDGGTIYPVYGGGGETFRMDRYNREDCLVIARFAMSKTCVRYVAGKFFLNDSGLSVKAKDELLQSFLNYHIVSLNDDIYNLGKGAAQRNLDVTSFRNLTIAIPPVGLQKKIVEELDLINSLINTKRKQLETYNKLEQSLFYEMFGDPVENSLNWDSKPLGDIADFKNGLNFGKTDNGQRYKFLGVSDFQNNSTINASLLGEICLEEYVSEDYFLRDGDIVFVRSNGSKELVGRSVLMQSCTEQTTYSGFCIRCRLHSNSVRPLFLSHILRSASMRPLITNSGRGCNISNLNQKILSTLPVIIPPIELQDSFAERIDAIAKLKNKVNATIDKLSLLLNSRMDFWYTIDKVATDIININDAQDMIKERYYNHTKDMDILDNSLSVRQSNAHDIRINVQDIEFNVLAEIYLLLQDKGHLTKSEINNHFSYRSNGVFEYVCVLVELELLMTDDYEIFQIC